MDHIYKKWIYLFLLAHFFLLYGCESSQPRLTPLKPTDTILAFGDSLTYGTGATPETSYPADLERLIGIKVVNAGKPGEETRDGLARMEHEMSVNSPQLVLICFGGNDFLHKRSYGDIQDNLKKMILYIQQRGAQVVLISVPRPSLNMDIPVLFTRLGKELNVPVENKLLANLLEQPELKSDYIHLNAAGYQKMAEELANFLKKVGAINQNS